MGSISYIRAVRDGVLVLLFAVALMWPAVVNGGPFWFPDTTNYIRSADAAMVYVTGTESEWSDRLERTQGASDAEAGAERSATSDALVPTRPVLAGRSIFYGVLIYLPMRFFGLWGGVAVQALIVAATLVFCITGFLRRLEMDVPAARLAIMGSLVVLTPLPLYTSMLMPDVFSGLLVLTLATAFCLWPRSSRIERAALIGGSAAMAAFHSTHLVLAVALAGGGFLLGSSWSARIRALAIAGSVVVIAVLANFLFSIGVQHALGVKPLMPPFLSARITAAGPGTTYLNATCPRRADFVLCRYRNRLPLDSDIFLWSEDPETGVFQVAGTADRRSMSDEDIEFFMSVAAADPSGFGRACVLSILLQLVNFDLEDFNYGDAPSLIAKLPERLRDSVAASQAARGTFEVSAIERATVFAALFALAMTAYLAGRIWLGTKRLDSKALRFALLLWLGFLANAVVCGSLSRPEGRYQMRIIWLLPLAAEMLIAGSRARNGRRRLPSEAEPQKC